LNRIDDSVVFHPLSNAHLLQIVDMLVNELNLQMLQSRNIHIEVSQEVKERLIRDNYQPTYGARPMRRAIQKHITDPLSEEMLRGRFKESQKILVTMKDDQIEFQEEEAGILAKV
jgi:ATP-dependent Clp protease ATP-binding subunit ClpC